jgi:hypothetical protein
MLSNKQVYKNVDNLDSSEKRDHANLKDNSLEEDENVFNESRQGSQGNQVSIVTEPSDLMEGSISRVIGNSGKPTRHSNQKAP